VGCGGDDGGLLSPSVDLTGQWTVTSDVDARNCGEGMYREVFDISIVQSGSALTVATPAGTFSGTIGGNQVNWTGSYAEDGGITTINLSLQASGDGNSIVGTDSWFWTDGLDSCSGASQISITRR
jgi:hypothetical protein